MVAVDSHPAGHLIVGNIDERVRAKNHYVPDFYLKNWAGADNKVALYRLLVPHANVPEWKRHYTGAVGYQQHLYTRLIGGRETDGLERRLDQEFESPAGPAIERVLSRQRLRRDDWHRLIRFATAQDFRTPKRLIETLGYFSSEANRQFQQCSLDSIATDLSRRLEAGELIEAPEIHTAYQFPGRVVIEPLADGSGVGIKSEIAPGRAAWLFALEHMLDGRVMEEMLRQRWTILCAPPGVIWPTSDNPVVRVKFDNPGQYQFTGIFGQAADEWYFPLSPQYLMYRRLGAKQYGARYISVSEERARFIQRLIIEHAHRHVYAPEELQVVREARPRHVDAEDYRHEREQWDDWHERQSQVEAEYLRG